MEVFCKEWYLKSFGLSCEDAPDKDDQRTRIKLQPANPGLPEKWPLECFCMYVCACMRVVCDIVSFVCCSIAGVFCAVVSHPADTIVSKLNQQKGSSFMQVGKNLGMLGKHDLYRLRNSQQIVGSSIGLICRFVLIIYHVIVKWSFPL